MDCDATRQKSTEAILLSAARPLLADLAVVPAGTYDVNTPRPWWRWWQPRERGGWIRVDRHDDGERTSLMWTTGKETHFALETAFSLDVMASGELVMYCESALSMWIKWGYGRRGAAELREALEKARWMHSKLCGAKVERACVRPAGGA